MIAKVGALITQFVSVPAWLNWIAICSACLITGYYIWRVNHLRLQPKLLVTRVISQRWRTGGNPFPNSNMPSAKTGTANRDAVAYYFEIAGASEASTIRDVRVQLTEINPPVQNLDWLPVLLFHKHDSPPHAKKFDLNPGDVKHIDLVSAYRWDDHFAVRHIVDGVNCDVPAFGHHRLTVAITASDTPKSLVSFDVWKDDDGCLQCEIIADKQAI